MLDIRLGAMLYAVGIMLGVGLWFFQGRNSVFPFEFNLLASFVCLCFCNEFNECLFNGRPGSGAQGAAWLTGNVTENETVAVAVSCELCPDTLAPDAAAINGYGSFFTCAQADCNGTEVLGGTVEHAVVLVNLIGNMTENETVAVAVPCELCPDTLAPDAAAIDGYGSFFTCAQADCYDFDVLGGS